MHYHREKLREVKIYVWNHYFLIVYLVNFGLHEIVIIETIFLRIDGCQ